MLPNKIINTSSRNTDGTSNFTAEVKAIQIGLERFLEENIKVDQLFVISDSQSAINAVANCYTSRDDLLQTIAKLVEKLPQDTELHLQWVPSHTGILGNETADQLAKLGTNAQLTSEQPLTASEQKSRRFAQIKKSWKDDVNHHWYVESSPGATIALQLSREEQTALSRMKSGHLRSMRFINGTKHFPQCSHCNGGEASPAHILQCIGLQPDSLYHQPGEVLRRLKFSPFMGLM